MFLWYQRDESAQLAALVEKANKQFIIELLSDS